MKNESPYILEWVAHYKILGFDTIYIYENDSTDKTPLVLGRLQGHIKYIPWPSLEKMSPQISAYNDAIKNTDAEWMLFCDADEFLILKNHENIHDFISDFDQTISCISINWRIFGSSGQVDQESGFVIERFIRAAHINFEVNKHVKSIVRTKDVVKMHIHAPVVSGKTIYPDGEGFQFSLKRSIPKDKNRYSSDKSLFYQKQSRVADQKGQRQCQSCTKCNR